MNSSKRKQQKENNIHKSVGKEFLNSDQDFRNFLQSVPIAIYEMEYSDHPRFKNANDAMCRLSGYSSEELLAINPFDMLTAESVRLFKERIEKALAGQKIEENVEYQVVIKGGRQISVVLNVKPVFKEGRFVSALVAGYDITERKKAEEELKATGKLLSAITDASLDAIYVKDRQSRWIFANPALERIAGKKFSEVLGKTDAEIYSNPEAGKKILEHDQKIMNSGVSETFDEFVDLPDGRHFYISVKSPRFDEKGNVIGLIGISHDITERQKVEKAVIEKEQSDQEKRRLETIIETTPPAVVIVDSERKITTVNQRAKELLGFDTVGLDLRSNVKRMKPRRMDGSPYPFESLPASRALRGEIVRNEEFNVENADGIIFPIVTSAAPIFNAEGKVIAAVIVFEDISKRKNLEKQLEDQQRLAAIGATAGMVGHDIRNPLQAMASDVYLAKAELDSIPQSEAKEGIRESLEDVQKNIEYVNKIVQDLQDYARPLAPTHKEIDLEVVFNDVLCNKAIRENIQVSRNVQRSVKNPVSDPDLLKRILSNLVNNAVQAMPKGGKLDVNASREGSDLIIIVKDTGVGIPDEFRAKLFTPLFTTKSKGQGFGLAIVKRMTEALGGTISFESEKGKGTKFILHIPFTPPKIKQ